MALWEFSTDDSPRRLKFLPLFSLKPGSPTFSILDLDGPPPISSLDDDLLWRIFNLNTLTYDDITESLSTSRHSSRECSLTTARHTSQVCVGWRSLMLASSSIWANTMNLKHLDQKNNDWRGEILKRTDNALLSIIGHLEVGRPAAQFFLSLLGDHWTRLRRISISVHDPALKKDKRWRSMQSPAPNLKMFCIWFPSPSAISTVDDVLFSNNARSIHTFSTQHIDFTFSGRWLSSLRCLNLLDCSVRQTILFAFAEMLRLETLIIINVDIIDIQSEDRSWPMVTLPKLTMLTLAVNFRTLIVLIGYIAATAGCIFKCGHDTDDTIVQPSPEDLSLLQRGFSAHFQNFSDFWPSDTMWWMTTKSTLIIRRELGIHAKANDESSFYFHLLIDSDSLWHGIPDLILQSLHSYDLSSIITLKLNLSWNALELSHLHFARLCRSLPFVGTMYTNSASLGVLVQLHEVLSGVILFPCLKSIVFEKEVGFNSFLIMRFLIQRRDAGVPIADLDLSDCTAEDIRSLHAEGINDLDVEWTTVGADEVF